MELKGDEMVEVEYKNVTKKYDDGSEAVKELNLKIKDGEFLTLVGPSGCGKSTLLRIIAGLEQQTSGDVLIDRKSMDGIAPNLRPINMVFQNYAIFPHLNVEENVAYGLRKKNLPKE